MELFLIIAIFGGFMVAYTAILSENALKMLYQQDLQLGPSANDNWR